MNLQVTSDSKRVLFLIKSERNQRYGILSLAAFLKERSHVLDHFFIENLGDIKALSEKIATFKPDYLAISAMSGEVMFYLSVLEDIKSIHPNLYVLMGGPHTTFDSTIVENRLIDAICIGEGEEAFAEFLATHPNGDYLGVRNFCFQLEDGSIIKNPIRPLIDINTLPIPDYDFIPRGMSLAGERIATFASRNCVYRCTYCFNRDYADKYREAGSKTIYGVMSVNRFMEKLHYLKDRYEGEFKYFHFQDDIFPIAKDWLEEFSERYSQEIGIPFRVGLNPVMIKERSIELLSKAGCFQLNFAIESGSERIRNDIMHRPKISNEDLIQITRMIKKYNIYLISQNIMMSPTETFEEAKATVELNIACKVDSGSTGKFQPYPGTAMAKFAVEKGLVKEGNILDMLPENYHHVSLLKFEEAEEVAMSNLVKLFSFVIRFPRTRKLVYFLVRFRSLEKLFQLIDDTFWMTYTHRPFDSVHGTSAGKDFKVFLKFLRKLIVPDRKEGFVYYG